MKLYLAGPMSGIPAYNYPAFHAEAARLRALGYHVENPAECGLPDGLPWVEYMRADIPRMLACDAIALLPGWENSEGARVEQYIALKLGMGVHMASDLVAGPCRADREGSAHAA